MPETSAPKMICNPQTTGLLFFKQVYEMVTTADCAELTLCQCFQLVVLLFAYRPVNGPIQIIKKFMVNLLIIDTTYSEGDFASDLIHNLL